MTRLHVPDGRIGDTALSLTWMMNLPDSCSLAAAPIRSVGPVGPEEADLYRIMLRRAAAHWRKNEIAAMSNRDRLRFDATVDGPLPARDLGGIPPVRPFVTHSPL